MRAGTLRPWPRAGVPRAPGQTVFHVQGPDTLRLDVISVDTVTSLWLITPIARMLSHGLTLTRVPCLTQPSTVQ